jgi:hypothetical protein
MVFFRCSHKIAKCNSQLCHGSLSICGPGSSVSIATGYRLDSPGIKSRWGWDFPHLSRLALGPTQPPVQWVPYLSRGVKSSQGVTLNPHPLVVLCSQKSRAIPLLPLWAVQPVQSLSACRRVHSTSVHLSVWNELVTTGWISMRYDILIFFENLSVKFKFC